MTLPRRCAALLIALVAIPATVSATGETGGLDSPAGAQEAAAEAADGTPMAQTEPMEPTSEPMAEPDAGSMAEPDAESAVEPEPMNAAPAPSTGKVVRATFTSAVIEREPIDSIEQLSTITNRVYFFTELVGFDGYRVFHRWQYGGETLAEVPFDVRGPRWRVYSSKGLVPGWVGSWTVTVVDESGRELARRSMEYNEAPEPVTPMAEEPGAAAAPDEPVAPLEVVPAPSTEQP